MTSGNIADGIGRCNNGKPERQCDGNNAEETGFHTAGKAAADDSRSTPE